MNAGCFVDILQQDGSKVRMFYPMTQQNVMFCTWAGIRGADEEKYQNKKEQARGENG